MTQILAARQSPFYRVQRARAAVIEIAELLDTEGVVAKLAANSKKQALQEFAKRAAQITGLQEREIFRVLVDRERLGTTGVPDWKNPLISNPSMTNRSI
jgi:hypothetical protein